MFRKKKAPVAIPPQKIEEVAPEVIKQIEEEFPEEDSAEKREHFERIIPGSVAQVFQLFTTFIWRENAQLGAVEEWVEIIKDASTPNGFEVGMIRKLNGYFGYEEEVTKVVKNRMIEFKIREGLPSSYNKSRVVFKPENDDKATRVIWTIFWTPASMVADMMYTVMMKGYCNLALYRLEQKILNHELEHIAQPQSSFSSESITTSPTHSEDGSNPAEREETSTMSVLTSGGLKDGEVPRLQWAARMHTGYEGNLTSEQEQTLTEVKEDLKKNHPDTWQLCETHPDGADRILLRFLRAECTGKARKFHIEKSKKRLIESLHFRQAWKAYEMLEHPPARNEDYIKAAGETVIIDNEGRPVVFTRAGLLSTCLDVKLMDDMDWKRNMVWASECRMQTMRESSKKLGHEVSASVIVYDLKGLGYNFRKIISFSKLMNEVGGPYYPEMVDVVVLLNAPAIFNALWTAMKAFLDPVTTSKVMVFGQGRHEQERTHKVLRTILNPQILPKEYGGESDLVVAYPAGAQRH